MAFFCQNFFLRFNSTTLNSIVAVYLRCGEEYAIVITDAEVHNSAGGQPTKFYQVVWGFAEGAEDCKQANIRKIPISLIEMLCKKSQTEVYVNAEVAVSIHLKYSDKTRYTGSAPLFIGSKTRNVAP